MNAADDQQKNSSETRRRSGASIKKRLEAQNHELATLLSVQQAITSRLNRQEVLQMIADGARRLTDSNGTAVYLLEGDVLRLAVLSDGPDSPNQPDLYIGYTIPLKQSLGKVAFETGKPLLIADVQNDPRLNADIRKRISIHSYLGVPLMAGSRPIGLLVAVDKVKSPLTSDDERILTLLASSAVIGLENARLYEEAEMHAALAERGRLARDLHDAVTQTLFSASLIAEVLPQIWEQDPEEGRRRLEQLRQSTRGALAEMRTLLLELRPSALLQAETSELFKYLVNAFTGRTQVPARLNFDGEFALPGEVKIGLYRIAQEALNNIARHAEAEEVSITFHCQLSGVTLDICDDGIGFDASGITTEHLGLRIMKERAAAIGAELSIESGQGGGTTVHVYWDPLTCSDQPVPTNLQKDEVAE
jgi:two-component system nitrate/nitrite sensor histidine kinase NarX